MALLTSHASGLLSSAATWRVCDAASRISHTAEDGWTVANGAFNIDTVMTFDGVTTIDGLGLRINRPTTITGGTLTITFRNMTDVIDVATVSVPIMEMESYPAAADSAIPWTMFDLPAFTPIAGKNYSFAIAATGLTGSGNITALRTGTAGQWLKLIRTTVTKAPATGDSLFIQGKYANGGTLTPVEVTADLTSTAIDLGPGGTPIITWPAIGISKGGTLKSSRGAAANYVMRLSGDLIIYGGGTLDYGTTADPIPRGTTSFIEFEQTSADGQFGLRQRGWSTWTMQGLSRTAGKNVSQMMLTASAAASAAAPSTSTANVDQDCGWLAGDHVAFSMQTSSRTLANCEAGRLNANAGASSIVVKDMTQLNTTILGYPLTSNRGLLYAHEVDANQESRVVLMTRNVGVRGASTTLQAFIQIGPATTHLNIITDVDWAEFFYLGANTTGKRGIEIIGTPGSAISFVHCCLHDLDYGGFWLQSWKYGIEILNCSVVFCLSGQPITMNASTVGVYNIQDFWAIRSNGGGASIADYNGTFKRIFFSGCSGNVVQLGGLGELGDFDGLVVQGGATSGLNPIATIWGTYKNVKIWHINSAGILYHSVDNLIIDGLDIFGTNGSCIATLSNMGGDLRIRNAVLSSWTAFGCTYGWQHGQNGQITRIQFDDTTFGVVNGPRGAFSGADIGATGQRSDYQVLLNRCILASTTEVSLASNGAIDSWVASMDHDGVVGNNKKWTRGGRVEQDTTVYRVVAPSLRLAPRVDPQTYGGGAWGSGTDLIVPPEGQYTLFEVGDFVVGAGIPSDTHILEMIQSTRQVRISNPTTGAQASTNLVRNRRLDTAYRLVPIEAGQTKIVKVWVRKSVVGDGSDYVGPQPRLMQRQNAALGLYAEVVKATCTSANGVWEELTCEVTSAVTGVIELFMTCSLAAGSGFVNVDDWSAS